MLGTQIELIEPLDDKSPITGFLVKNPSGGQHHICFEVDDIEQARAEFENMGRRILAPTSEHMVLLSSLSIKRYDGSANEIMESPKEKH